MRRRAGGRSVRCGCGPPRPRGPSATRWRPSFGRGQSGKCLGRGARNDRSAGDRRGVATAVVVVAAQMGDLAKVAEGGGIGPAWHRDQVRFVIKLTVYTRSFRPSETPCQGLPWAGFGREPSFEHSEMREYAQFSSPSETSTTVEGASQLHAKPGCQLARWITAFRQDIGYE